MGDALPVRGFRKVMEALGGEPLLKTAGAVSIHKNYLSSQLIGALY